MRNIRLLYVLLVCAFPVKAFCSEDSAPATQTASNLQPQLIKKQAREIKELSAKVDKLECKMVVEREILETDEKTKLGTVEAAIICACIAAGVAIFNQHRQAKQNRLLKSIEIIMSSANGYQAGVRADNLDIFLDKSTRKHLEDIKDRFSGEEHTELAVSLAQSMSEKAESPEEVLAIWQSVVKNKHAITHVEYSRNSGE